MIIERKNEEKMFSTFLQLKWGNNHFVDPDEPWKSDRKLQQNARIIIQSTPMANERTLAENWMREYHNDITLNISLENPPDSMARWHLAAYFEESCFWVAHKLAQKRAGKSSYFYLLQEYFQIARSIAAQPENILQGYNSNYSNSLKSVKNWGQLKLTTAILEKTGEKTYSDAGMLRRQTKTSLERALQHEGITSLPEGLLKRLDIKETQLARCLLAWKIFDKVYTPTTPRGSKQLLWPDADNLQDIAAEYNKQATACNLTPSITAQSIDQLLKICVIALRNSSGLQISKQKEFSSIPDQKTIYETEAGIEMFDNTEIRECLSNAFAALPKEAQIMLKLWHGLGFNQGDVGELFGIERNQIANTVKTWRISLLQELIKYLGKPMTAQEIKQKSTKMDLWLEDYCRDDFVYFLSNTLNNELRDLQLNTIPIIWILLRQYNCMAGILLLPKSLNGDIPLLQKCYNKGNFDLKAGANYLKIPATEVSQRLEKVKEHLGHRLTDYVASQLTSEMDQILYEALITINLVVKVLTIDLVTERLANFMTSVVRSKAEFLDAENQDIAKFVEEWLTKNKANKNKAGVE